MKEYVTDIMPGIFKRTLNQNIKEMFKILFNLKE